MSAWQTWHTPQQLEHANAYYVRLREERERWGVVAKF